MRGAPGAIDVRRCSSTRPSRCRAGRERPRRRGAVAAADARRAAVQVPLRDGPAPTRTRPTRSLRLAATRASTALARQLTGRPADHLRRRQVGRELPAARLRATASGRPAPPLPLDAFLFEDRIGYCQQFSGAMALMLRMVGIPARVAAGFSPGSYNRDTGEYRVRDLDAHSWVEVYFTGSAGSRSTRRPGRARRSRSRAAWAPTSAAGGDAGEVRSRRRRRARLRAGGAAATAARRRGRRGGRRGGRSPCCAARAGAALGCGWLRAPPRRRWPRRRRGGAARRAAPRARAARLGAAGRPPRCWRSSSRLGRTRGPGAARYAARLRAHRYDPRAPDAPGAADRRALRRELGARGGPLARLPRPGSPSRPAVRARFRSVSKVADLQNDSMMTALLATSSPAWLGGLVVLVVGAVLIATDVIDAGETKRSCARPPIAQPGARRAKAGGKHGRRHLQAGGPRRRVRPGQRRDRTDSSLFGLPQQRGHGHRLGLRGGQATARSSPTPTWSRAPATCTVSFEENGDPIDGRGEGPRPVHRPRRAEGRPEQDRERAAGAAGRLERGRGGRPGRRDRQPVRLHAHRHHRASSRPCSARSRRRTASRSPT